MRRIFVLACICTQLGFAQQTRLDSLLTSLRNHPHEDTIKLNLLSELAYMHYPYSNPDSGLILADAAISLAQQLSSPAKLGYAYRCKGINYWSVAEYTKALDMYSMALHEYETAGDEDGTGDTFNNIGVVYLGLSDYANALEYYLKAMHIYERTGSNRLANVLSNIGLVYKNMGDSRKALEFLLKALPLYEGTGNSRGIVNALGNIGNVYDDLDSTTQALEYHHRALLLNRSLNSKKGVANNLNSIGVIYNGIGNYTKALEYLEKSLKLYEELGDRSAQAVTLYEIGKTYRMAPEGFLVERGIPASMRYTKAIAFQQRSAQLSAEIGSVHRESFAWEELSIAYEAQGEFSKALTAFKKAVELRDSVASERSRSQIEVKAAQYEFEKREALLKAEHNKREELAFEKLKQQRIQNNSIMGGVAILLIAGVSSFLFYKKRTEADQRRKEAEFRMQVTETEMKALRSQMNPHFIFNSLNSISDFISKHDIKSADYYLTKFAKLMRLILEHSEKKEVPLADDLKALELYMQLEAMRLNNKFVYEVHVDGSIDKEATLVPPLLLQPFVENSIWHGIAHKDGSGRIKVRIERQNGSINCIVEDNGVGRKGQSLVPEGDKKQSYGIKITKARIDILNQIKQADATVELSDLAEGTRVEVKLPLAVAD
ncbi:MAG: tetratricopeptide repeat protein [Bacteroidetes bacterium]|nr:tetratricopeptide repeat protein [Bacteroidota bacterium]MCW5894272.1 tetratricopeptide repeat protein [Bacteroidota bacterium]